MADCYPFQAAIMTLATVAVGVGIPSCGLVISFDDYGRSGGASSTAAGLFAVRGTVEGLETERLTLILNGTALEVGEGPFAFPPTLADGVEFNVSVRSPPQHACSVRNGNGKIAAADATGVEVACLSRNATLTNLTISSGALTPAFQTGTLAYRARVRAGRTYPLGPPSAVPGAVITATSTHPGTQIMIGGATVFSGTPSAPVALALGVNPLIDVMLTAPDRVAQTKYSIGVRVEGHDYLKASGADGLGLAAGGVAISGNTLVAGAGSGAYVFVRSGSTWSEQAHVNVGASSSWPSVALDGDNLAVLGSVDGMFGVSIFTRASSSWTKQASFALPPHSGTTVPTIALSGATLAVGTCEPNIGPSAYVFTKASGTWSQPVQIKPTGQPAGDRCQFTVAPMDPWPVSVAISGDRLALGVATDASAASGIDGDQNDTSATGAGAVHVFVRSGSSWSSEAYVKASTAREATFFGGAVALVGTTMIVGSVRDVNGPDRGSVYVFERGPTSWIQQARITSGQADDIFFGNSVALAGDFLVVGAPNQTAAGYVGGGAVFAFKRSAGTWSRYVHITSPHPATYAAFGRSVAVTDDSVVVAVPAEKSRVTTINGEATAPDEVLAGAIYVF